VLSVIAIILAIIALFIRSGSQHQDSFDLSALPTPVPSPYERISETTPETWASCATTDSVHESYSYNGLEFRLCWYRNKRDYFFVVRNANPARSSEVDVKLAAFGAGNKVGEHMKIVSEMEPLEWQFFPGFLDTRQPPPTWRIDRYEVEFSLHSAQQQDSWQ